MTQPVEPDALVERGEEARRPPSGVDRSTPAPQAWAVSRQKPTRRSATPRAAIASAMSASSVDASSRGRTRPRPSSRGRAARPRASSSTSARTRATAVREPRRARRDRRVAVRPDVDVDEPRPERRGPPGARCASSSTERSKKSGSGPARLTRYDAWIATGPMSRAASRSRNAGSSAGGSARRRQAVGLSPKTWSAVAPISWARSTAFDHAGRQRQVGTEASAVGKHGRIVRCGSHGSRPADRASGPGGPDPAAHRGSPRRRTGVRGRAGDGSRPAARRGPPPAGQARRGRARVGAAAATRVPAARSASRPSAPWAGAWRRSNPTRERIRAPASGRPASRCRPDVARVLRGYFEADRLTTIPARGSKRLVVLRYLRDRIFTEDRAYPEKEVNQRLALFHPDVASLRRYLVDEGLLTRAEGRVPEPGLSGRREVSGGRSRALGPRCSRRRRSAR